MKWIRETIYYFMDSYFGGIFCLLLGAYFLYDIKKKAPEPYTVNYLRAWFAIVSSFFAGFFLIIFKIKELFGW